MQYGTPENQKNLESLFLCLQERETSLNEQLLWEPENTSTLTGGIFTSRVDDVAVTANIERMFHQVYVAPEYGGALLLVVA